MAQVKYGQFTIETSDYSAARIRTVIGRILRAGGTEWYPMTYEEGGQTKALEMLITPGVPILVTTDDDIDDINEVEQGLWDKYAPKDDESAVVEIEPHAEQKTES